MLAAKLPPANHHDAATTTQGVPSVTTPTAVPGLALCLKRAALQQALGCDDAGRWWVCNRLLCEAFASYAAVAGCLGTVFHLCADVLALQLMDDLVAHEMLLEAMILFESRTTVLLLFLRDTE